MGRVQDEANRRWPDEPKDSGRPTHPRFSAYRRGFRLGAWWQARQPTDDAKLEEARLAGAAEAFDAINGYINLMWANNRGAKSDAYRDGFNAATGRIYHMMAEARGQIEGEREVRIFEMTKDGES